MLLVKLRLRRRRKRNERHLPISMWEEEFVWPEDPQQESSPPHLRGPGIQADKLRPCLSWQCIQPAADSGNSWSPEDTSLVLEKKGGGEVTKRTSLPHLWFWIWHRHIQSSQHKGMLVLCGSRVYGSACVFTLACRLKDDAIQNCPK